MTQEALRMALEVLEKNTKHLPADFDYHFEAITAIKEALAQTQEPVANDPLPRACNLAGVDYQTFLKIKAYMPVAPPQRTWVGLTDEEIFETHKQVDSMQYLTFANAIEAKLKERNT